MSVRECNHNKCPTAHTSDSNTIACHMCKKDFHLPCYDIIAAKSRIFINKHIVFLCDACIECPSPKRKPAGESKLPTKGESTINSSNRINASTLSSETATSAPIVVSNKRMFDLLIEVSAKIDNNSSTLSQLKDGVDSIHSTIRDNKNTYANVLQVRQNQHTGSAPELQPTNSSAANKTVAVREEQRNMDAETKIALKKRQLTAGKSAKQGLGAPVEIQPRKTATVQRTQLNKSVYVSRIDPSVTTDNLVEYIKNELPNVDVKHFLPRLLVKKGQNLEELTYVSFRLQCTEALYDAFISPDFWPSHVKIGEFIEKQSDKRAKLSEFIAQKINDLSTGGLIDLTAPNSMSMETESTSSLIPPTKNDAINTNAVPPEQISTD